MILRLILMIFFAADIDAFSQESDSLKCWSDHEKLKWSDFQGEIPENSDLRASTSYSLDTEPFVKNHLLSYHIKIAFNKYKSWKIDTTKELLYHEQLHFDIAELAARKMRKAIRHVSETIHNPISQDFRTALEEVFLECEKIQDDYDFDTAHGIIDNSQIEWEKKIHLELEKLKDYASTPADCR